jgi:ABC-2 type transport system permease protein
MISSLAGNPVNASRFGMIIALPSFVLAGYTWPLEAMPRWLQLLTRELPQTWFFQGINYLTFKNPGWAFMSRYFLALLAIAGVCYSVAAVVFSRKSFRVRRAG